MKQKERELAGSSFDGRIDSAGQCWNETVGCSNSDSLQQLSLNINGLGSASVVGTGSEIDRRRIVVHRDVDRFNARRQELPATRCARLDVSAGFALMTIGSVAMPAHMDVRTNCVI
ncbi:hypothetical protein Mal15_26040 [Stieleria maiorica]|uniref:Uncharacterized protein n=1 Tax=Stieleria maiorica TaxID=2795974 RepID=A0A5B9MBI8_9BACT|nr:hypothetical protein [Stieleria maiorica]QEF98552.1 hypothetical protein Mal15_26040 [Stieleria maiorica]